MNAFNREDAIKEFLKLCGDNHPHMFLKWWQRETFFDQNVQTILIERHPKNMDYESASNIGYPIFAWSTAEQQSLGTCSLDGTEICANEITRHDPLWFPRLAMAVREARIRINQWRKTPETVLHRYIVWRDKKYLWETDSITPSNSPEFIKDAIDYCVPDWESNPKYSRDDCIRKMERARIAIQKAITIENQRRDEIQVLWAECWLTHIRGCEPPQNANDLANKVLLKSNVTKKSPNR